MITPVTIVKAPVVSSTVSSQAQSSQKSAASSRSIELESEPAKKPMQL